jgi:hypothetical protein
MTLEIGQRLGNISLIDPDGNPWRPADHRGRPLVLVLHRHLG